MSEASRHERIIGLMHERHANLDALDADLAAAELAALAGSATFTAASLDHIANAGEETDE